MIITILESSSGLALEGVQEKLLKKYEKKQQKETSEGAFRGQNRGRTMRQHESDQKVQEGSQNSVEDVTDAISWVTNNLIARQKPQEHE